MKIVLSDRMKRIADMVTPGRVTADIGCDHGLVSAYLVDMGICPKVYAMDVAEGPLESAKKNTREFSDRIELRLSDGFEALEKGETDCAIIAGMGGHLVLSILEGGMEKMTAVKCWQINRLRSQPIWSFMPSGQATQLPLLTKTVLRFFSRVTGLPVRHPNIRRQFLPRNPQKKPLIN